MKKYNFRFVDQPEDPNIGLTNEEIAFLQKELNLQFPENYIYYLQKAGKRSNVFPVEYNITKLEKYQKQLKKALKERNLLSTECLFCFQHHIEYEPLVGQDFETFYFFDLSDPKSPDLYVFGDFITNFDWRGYEKELINKENFVDFINYKTKEKFRIKEKIGIKDILVWIILIPVFIIILIIIIFQNVKEKIKNQ
ncbi:SMI1/KNR4 family protein [Chryseobacterium sp. RRHN12]|uniref:SMI1/KNR4 family protein n=1 Tax=Chryseobacterium sp. RRHN12 TaxID=3437884 RepID=UPI003D9B5F35